MFKKMSLLTIVLTFSLLFGSFAMADVVNGDFIRKSPLNEEENSSYEWTWLNDEHCVQFTTKDDKLKREHIERKFNMGLLPQWAVNGDDGTGVVKKRDTYSGKWTQSEKGIWSFEFDDKTIPLGVTKIDDVLYAFNGYGELMEGYEYYDGLTTGADGVVNSDNPDFLAWLETQYVPACTSHE